MPKLTILRGVSGSGKSTFAESQAGNPVIVSRDRLRVAFYNDDGPNYYKVPKDVLHRRESFITKSEHRAIADALVAGHNVISDNTNIEWKWVQQVADIGFKAGAHVEIRTFDISLDDALERNARRAEGGGRNVPEDTIRRQHSKFQGTKKRTVSDLVQAPKPKPYHGTPGAPRAIMVDLDGTLFHMNGKRGPYDLNVEVDDVDEVIADIIATLGETGEFQIIAMSGRKEAARRKSENAMLDNGIPFDWLFMRADDDNRKDSYVKSDLFDEHVRDNFDVVAVFDDRNQVVDMWREMGIKCLQVAEGDF